MIYGPYNTCGDILSKQLDEIRTTDCNHRLTDYFQQQSLRR